MMFVFGEVSDPLYETTCLVEDIVRSQVIELVRYTFIPDFPNPQIIQAAQSAQMRGSRFLNAEDLIFLIRHDRGKVNRLRTYLSWKDVRKKAKDSGGPADGADAAVDIIDATAGGAGTDKSGAPGVAKMQKTKVKLCWEILKQYDDFLTGDTAEDFDEDEVEAYNDSVQRLKDADEVTRAMTREEYVHYSECRQASFTYRKVKRFRDWCYMSQYADTRPNDDTVDILGFLTFEMVSKLTETALLVKKEADARIGMASISNLNKRKREESPEEEDVDAGSHLFSLPPSDQTPLQPQHITDAFWRLQRTVSPLKNFRGGLTKTRICLI